MMKEVLISLDISIAITKSTLTDLKNAHYKNLTLVLEVRSPPSAVKELYLQVTDESDPSVLLTSTITETDYQKLSSNQGLLLDFNSFPSHFANRIKQCFTEQEKVDPKFVLLLQMDYENFPPNLSKMDSEAFLKVLEVNVIQHISIPLIPAPLSTKINYLCTMTKSLKSSVSSEWQDFQAREQNLSSEMERLRLTVSKKDQDIETLLEDFKQREAVLNLREANAFEKAYKIQSDADRKLAASERRDLDSKKKQIAEMQKKISDLTKDILKLENHTGELKQELHSVKGEGTKRKEETMHLRAKLRAADVEIRRLRETTEKLESDNLFLRTSLTQNDKDLHYLKDETQKKLDDTENALEKTKDALSRTQSSQEEIKINFDRSLHVIKEHQEKIYDLNAKRKLLLTDLSEKEKGLSLKGALLKKAENSLKTLQQKAVKDDERSERLSELLEKAKNKMDELDHVIKDNQSEN